MVLLTASVVMGSAIYPRANEDRCKTQRNETRCAAHLQMQLQLSAGRSMYYYLFRQDESLINDRLIGFLDGGVITSKRDLAHVDGKG